MSQELPRGWAVARLRDLAGPDGIFTDGDWILSEHLKTGNDVRLIQLADIGVGHFLNKSQKFLSHGTANELGATFLREGDLLISRMADPLARACVFPKIDRPAITAVDVAIGRCDGTVSVTPFLMHLCNSHRVLVQAEEVAVGTTRKRISRKNLEQIRVPLAPLAEQRRIVAKLEKLLAKVDACQQRLAKIPVLLKRFRQSVLAAACSGRLTADWREERAPGELASSLLDRVAAERAAAADYAKRGSPPAALDVVDVPEIPELWTWATLDQIVQEGRPIIYGIIKPGPHDPKGVPYVRVFEMKDGRVAPLSELKRASAERASKFTRATLRAGDLLVSKDGTIGRVAVVPPELVGGNITQHLVRASIHPLICRDYVVSAIRSPWAQNWLVGEKKGVALQGVNVEDFRRLPIPLPPRAEQREIVRRTATLFALADQIEARFKKAQAQVDKLTPSLLARAFSGKLVPQDPNDEPAEELLERIRNLKRIERNGDPQS